jgi:hypothetical protein
LLPLSTAAPLPAQDTAASGDASFANVQMAGQDVFKFAVRSVPAVIEAALVSAGLGKEDVDWLVMHQANQRILDAAATRLGLPAERVREGARGWWCAGASRCASRSGCGGGVSRVVGGRQPFKTHATVLCASPLTC